MRGGAVLVNSGGVADSSHFSNSLFSGVTKRDTALAFTYRGVNNCLFVNYEFARDRFNTNPNPGQRTRRRYPRPIVRRIGGGKLNPHLRQINPCARV